MSRCCLLLLLLLAALPLAWAAQPGDELLVNGNLEQADASGKRPAGWNWGSGVVWANENGNHWAVEDAPQPTSLSIGQRIPLEEGYWKLRVSCRVRVTDVKLGPEGWHNARIAMQFQDADRKMVGGWPNVLNFTGSTKGWETQSRGLPRAVRRALAGPLLLALLRHRQGRMG